METMELNRLPQPTWRHLRVNSKRIDCPELTKTEASWQLPQGCAAVLSASETAPQREGGLGADILKVPPAGDTLVLPAGTACEEALLLTLPAAQSAYTLTIRAEEGSDYKVIILLQGEGEGTHLLRIAPEVAKNAKLSVSVAQMFGRGMTSLQDLAATVGDHAFLSVAQLELGASDTIVGNRIEIAGAYAAYEADFGYRLADGQLDVNLIMRHTGPHSTSRMDALGVLEDGGRKCFRDTIDLVRGCHGAKGGETEDVLMLGDDVVNQSVPLILCDEEDVEGNHGATIGRLNEQMLYYMASRGIDEETAREIMATARMRAVCEKIPSAQAQETILAWLDASMKETAHA